MFGRQTISLSILVVLSSCLFLFQSCDRPYTLNLEDPSRQSATTSQTTIVINDGAELTKDPNLKIQLSSKYAQEFSLSTDPGCTGEWKPFASEVTQLWQEGDGIAHIYVKFRNFRKEESPCYSQEITIDTTPPQLSFLSKVNLIDRSPNAEFDLGIVESVSGLAQLECMAKKKADANGSFVPCESRVQLTGLADAVYVLQVKASDKAGNTSQVLSYEWTVNSKAPGLQVTKQPAPYTAIPLQQFEFTVASSGSAVTVTCKVDSQTFANCVSPWTVSGLADGEHQVSIKASDGKGNTATYEYQYMIDRVKPSLTITSQPPSLDHLTTAKITFIGNDADSKIEGFYCKLDAAAEIPCSNAGFHFIEGLGEGSHTLSIVSKDRAGNRSNAKAVTWSVEVDASTVVNGLVGYWRFDESSGTVAADSLGNANGKLLAMQANPWMPAGGKNQGALLVNNTTKANRIEIGDVFDFVNNDSFSFSMWIFRINGDGANYLSIMSKGVKDANGRQGWSASVCNNCGTAHRGLSLTRFRDGAEQVAVDLTGPVPLNVWTHVAGTYDGQRLRLYRNGSLVATSAAAALKTINHNGPLTIGNTFNGGFVNGFRGRVDDVRLYERLLTAAEVEFLAKP